VPGPYRVLNSLVLGAVVALAQVGSSLASSGATIECGQLGTYVAPDPTGPTPGSIALGLLTPWEIVATATVSANAAAALPTLMNTGPTCLSLELDSDGKITSLDFASEGAISGDVAFDSGSGFYVFANRLIVPTFITDAYPGIAALFVTSYQAGTELSVTFSVNQTTGSFTGFDGQATFCGKAGVTNTGDGEVGKATIPAAVLDPADIASLEQANGSGACATVHAVGVIVPNSEGQIQVQTDVTITLDAPPTAQPTPASQPDTSTVDPTPRGDARDAPAQLLMLILATAILVVTRERAKVR
jgi:hypothetical protein